MKSQFIIQDIKDQTTYVGMAYQQTGIKGNEYRECFDFFPCHPVYYSTRAEALKQINSKDFKGCTHRVLTIQQVYIN